MHVFTNDSSAVSPSAAPAFPEIIGRSGAVTTVLSLVSKISRSECAVLIRGESGTGKELIARAIHRLSMRADKPFITLNCSAIPETLLESELFGHEKGSFTGAERRHPGVFERANGGTLFLDEIGDMALSLQAKLLRVLQEKRFTPVGGSELKTSDVRIITATHVDLVDAMQRNSFRSDLYYRINVLPVDLPPLRERKEDVRSLLNHFIQSCNRMHTSQPESYFQEDVLTCLENHRWPGNIRQLQNLVERLVITSGGGEITMTHLPAEITHNQVFPTRGLTLPNANRDNTRTPQETLPNEGINLAEFVSNLEDTLIKQALVRTNNNRNQAAKLLGMNRTTLVERLRKKKIITPDEII